LNFEVWPFALFPQAFPRKTPLGINTLPRRKKNKMKHKGWRLAPIPLFFMPNIHGFAGVGRRINPISDNKGTILLVEDNEDLRKLYEDILTFDGFGVTTAVDGEQGWELAKANKPDFILLDLEMPKLNGFGMLELIRGNAATRNIPVIVFSAMHMESEVQKALDLGANGYVIKGVHTPRYVLGTIKSLMPKKTVEPPPKAGNYKIQVKEYRQDAAGQWQEIIAIAGYRCPQCGEEYILEMFPSTEEDGTHWFYSRFACPKCGTFF
jgi:CheY-like chemotaxis protein/predicted RNA-binding Zn-ribbon protein involved in translation (DUF1610 family)